MTDTPPIREIDQVHRETPYVLSLVGAFIIGAVVGAFIPGIRWAIGAVVGAVIGVLIMAVIIWLFAPSPQTGSDIRGPRSSEKPEVARALMYLRARRETLAGDLVAEIQDLSTGRPVARTLPQVIFNLSRRSARLGLFPGIQL